MTTQKYGPQTREIEARRELWLETLADAGIVSQDTEAVWGAIQEAVDNKLLDLLAGDFSTPDQLRALYRTWELAMDRQNNKQPPTGPTNDEIISKLQKEVAYRDATIQGGIAALAIKNEQLAIAKRKIRRWKKKAKKSQAELAKFSLCYDSNGCYDESFGVHIVDAADDSFVDNYGGEPMRTVWHKDGE